MSLRATFLLLLFANLAFLGWADLIDAPPEPPPSESISHLPQLKLLSEERSARASSASAIASAGAGVAAPPAATSSSSAPAHGAVSPGTADGTSTSSAPGAASQSSAIAGGRGLTANSAAAKPPRTDSAAASAAVPGGAAVPVAGGHRCITVGPFADPERAREASDLLRERGFAPRPRLGPGRAVDGYWVYVGGLKSSSDEAKVLKRLETNGISDAKAMLGTGTALRVSVGLFTARDGAERRARAVRRLGLDAEIEPRQAPGAHWVDVDLDSSGQSIPAEGLLLLEESGSRLEIKECPSASPGAGATPGPGSTPVGKPPAAVPDYHPMSPKPLTAEGRPRPG